MRPRRSATVLTSIACLAVAGTVGALALYPIAPADDPATSAGPQVVSVKTSAETESPSKRSTAGLQIVRRAEALIVSGACPSDSTTVALNASDDSGVGNQASARVSTTASGRFTATLTPTEVHVQPHQARDARMPRLSQVQAVCYAAPKTGQGTADPATSLKTSTSLAPSDITQVISESAAP